MSKLIRPALALLTLALAACQDTPFAPTADAAPASTARYVVRLRDGIADPAAYVGAKVRLPRTRLLQTFSGGVFPGFVAELTADGAAALARNPDVVAIEPDQAITAAGTQSGAPWGLDRIDQRPLPLNGAFGYAAPGTGVRVYVFDTGINYAHAEFEGRAVPGMDYATAGGSGTDCHGHGTHVAGTIGGRTYGVAKRVTLVSVRVLDCNMAGSMSAAVQGLNWVTSVKKANPGIPMVVNMSVEGSSGSLIFDSALNNAVAAGITIVVAAGNRGSDACTRSPARVPGVVTVSASDSRDVFAPYSNWGSCIDLTAPGSGVTSAWIGSTTASRAASGTSMASPHVAGAAALHLAKTPTATPVQVVAALTGNATAGQVAGVPAGTVNRLLNVAYLGVAP